MAKSKNKKVDTKESIVKSQNENANEKKYARFIEESKFRSDYLKHIATLDTGSIVIMATFLQNYIKEGSAGLLLLAVVSLLVSLTSVVMTQHFLASTISHSTEDVTNIPTSLERLFYRISTIVALVGFVIGLSVLGVFLVYSAI